MNTIKHLRYSSIRSKKELKITSPVDSVKFRIMTPLEQEISELKDELQNMFIAVNMQLEKCEEAFINYDVDLASEITNTEKRINALELKIDRDCENILALNQPGGDAASKAPSASRTFWASATRPSCLH